MYRCEVLGTTHLDNLFVAEYATLRNVGRAAIVCVDDTMPLQHGASLATVSQPVDAKLRRIAAARTQIRVLARICAVHGWQTARRCAEKWSQAYCPARKVFTPQLQAATLFERAAQTGK
jgi:Lon protease-like protein